MPFAGKQAECKNLEIEMSFKHMNLIVFDLEWNIGYQPKTFDYHGTEQTLRGEIIQIGAVKIDANARVLDTFRINLKPRIFKKLQHHIAKVTGMTQNDLDMGVPIREGGVQRICQCIVERAACGDLQPGHNAFQRHALALFAGELA